MEGRNIIKKYIAHHNHQSVPLVSYIQVFCSSYHQLEQSMRIKKPNLEVITYEPSISLGYKLFNSDY